MIIIQINNIRSQIVCHLEIKSNKTLIMVQDPFFLFEYKNNDWEILEQRENIN